MARQPNAPMEFGLGSQYGLLSGLILLIAHGCCPFNLAWFGMRPLGFRAITISPVKTAQRAPKTKITGWLACGVTCESRSKNWPQILVVWARSKPKTMIVAKQSENESADLCTECSGPFELVHKSIVNCTSCFQKSHFECAEYARSSIGQQMSRNTWRCSTCLRSDTQQNPGETSLRKSSELPKVISRFECREQLSNADKVVYNGITISKTPVQTPKKNQYSKPISVSSVPVPTASPQRSQSSSTPGPQIVSSTVSKRYKKNSQNIGKASPVTKSNVTSQIVGLTITRETVQNSTVVANSLIQNGCVQPNDVIELDSDEDDIEILSESCQSSSQPAVAMTSSSSLPVTSAKKTPKVSPRRADLPPSLYHRRSRSNLSTLFESNSESDSQQTMNMTIDNSVIDNSAIDKVTTKNHVSTNVISVNGDTDISAEDDKITPRRIVKVLVDDKDFKTLIDLGFEVVD